MTASPPQSPAPEPTNVERLLKHLDEGSLARRLVEAHRDRGVVNAADAVSAALKTRLEEVRGSFADAKD